MNTSFNSVLSYINALSLREKLLLLVVFFAVVYSVWDIFFFSEYIKRQQQTQSEQQTITTQQQELTVSIAQAQAKLSNDADPNTKIKQSIAKATADLEVSQTKLEQKLDRLVSPTKITELLRSLLLQSQGLKLLSLNNEAVHVIKLNQGEPQQAQDKQIQTQLYEHATTIKFSGNYLQLHHYLVALESSPWGLFWDQLEYVVKDYPNAEISLRVHTVSTDEHWIGL